MSVETSLVLVHLMEVLIVSVAVILAMNCIIKMIRACAKVKMYSQKVLVIYKFVSYVHAYMQMSMNAQLPLEIHVTTEYVKILRGLMNAFVQLVTSLVQLGKFVWVSSYCNSIYCYTAKITSFIVNDYI